MSNILKEFSTASEGLAYEADLFDGEDVHVGVWTCQEPAIVCPATFRKKPLFEGAKDHSAANGWPVETRRTGGGAVPLGPGVMNICMVFSVRPGFSITEGYKMLTRVFRDGFGAHGALFEPGATPGSFCDGDWNLSLDGRKVVGTAQRWRPIGKGNNRVLAHALILTHGDLAPGAEAVDAFHAELGLEPILTEVHTTVADALGITPQAHEDLARSLHAAAMQELETLEQLLAEGNVP